VTEVCCDMRLPRHCLSPKWLSKSYYLQHLAKLDPSRLEASKRDQVIDTLERRNKRALQNMLRWPNPTLYSCCGLTGSYRDHSRPCRHPVSIHLAQKTAAGHRTNNGNSQSTLSQRLVTPWRSHGALDSGCLSGLGQQGALRLVRQNLSCQLHDLTTTVPQKNAAAPRHQHPTPADGSSCPEKEQMSEKIVSCGSLWLGVAASALVVASRVWCVG
jgi:hypothetical protein